MRYEWIKIEMESGEVEYQVFDNLFDQVIGVFPTKEEAENFKEKRAVTDVIHMAG